MRRASLACVAALFLLVGLALPPAHAQQPPPLPAVVLKRPGQAPKPQAPPPSNQPVLAIPYAVAVLGLIAVMVVLCMPSRKHA